MEESRGDKKKVPSEQTIYVGILIDRRNSIWQVGRRSHFLYRELTHVAQTRHIVAFFFFARDVDWEKRQITGMIWENGRWRQRIFPLPKIIYSRIVEREWENRPVNQDFLAKVDQDPDVTLFNSRFLNKYEVAQALDFYPELRKYLPQTDAGSQANLKNMFEQYSTIYIKPMNGCKGQGIFVLQKNASGRWKIKSAAVATKKRYAKNLEQVLKILQTWQVDLEQCILQQGISRATYLGRAFDVRALSQKDGQGNWTYVGAAARLAAPGREVTHVVNGGKRVDLAHILEKSSSLKKKQTHIQNELRWLCQIVPVFLEKQISLHWGLFAFDIALTPEGKLYLLEVNSRPGSYSESKIRRRSLEYLMAYCRYIAEGGQTLESSLPSL